MTDERQHWIEQISEAVRQGVTIDGRARKILDAATQLMGSAITVREAEALLQLQLATLKMVGIWEGDPRASDVLHRVVTAWFAFERAWSREEDLPPDLLRDQSRSP